MSEQTQARLESALQFLREAQMPVSIGLAALANHHQCTPTAIGQGVEALEKAAKLIAAAIDQLDQ